MYEVELSKYTNPQVNRLCLVMDIVEDHFKDHNDSVKMKVKRALRKFANKISKMYDEEDFTVTPHHENLINAFYESIILSMEELKSYGAKVYFVDFVGMFNMNIYEHCTYFYKKDFAYHPTIMMETIVDLFGKKIADFQSFNPNGSAHVFKTQQDCDIFCYFVSTLNKNLLVNQ